MLNNETNEPRPIGEIRDTSVTGDGSTTLRTAQQLTAHEGKMPIGPEYLRRQEHEGYLVEGCPTRQTLNDSSMRSRFQAIRAEVPLPGAGDIVNVPPVISARSRRLRIPEPCKREGSWP